MWWETIGQIFKFFNILLPIFIDIAKARKEREELELKRIKDAQIAEEAAYKKATENQAICEQANLKAAALCMDIAWKDTMSLILKSLNEEHPEKAIAQTKLIDHPVVNGIIMSDVSNEVKAMRITNVKFGSNFL